MDGRILAVQMRSDVKNLDQLSGLVSFSLCFVWIGECVAIISLTCHVLLVRCVSLCLLVV